MAISATPYGSRQAREPTGHVISAVGGQTGNAVAVANDDVSSAIAQGGLYRIIATSECTVRIGAGLTDATNGEYWPEGHCEYRYLVPGDIIAVDAPA